MILLANAFAALYVYFLIKPSKGSPWPTGATIAILQQILNTRQQPSITPRILPSHSLHKKTNESRPNFKLFKKYPNPSPLPLLLQFVDNGQRVVIPLPQLRLITHTQTPKKGSSAKSQPPSLHNPIQKSARQRHPNGV